jgi:hypothetical protein
MTEEFNPEKSHEENVKVAIDNIIGQKTNLRKKKQSGEDQKRVTFNKIISSIVEIEERTIMIDETLSIDLNKYNQPFFDLVDNFFKLVYNKEQINLINFFLYERYAPDGSIMELVSSTGSVVNLNTADDLWFLLKMYSIITLIKYFNFHKYSKNFKNFIKIHRKIIPQQIVSVSLKIPYFLNNQTYFFYNNILHLINLSFILSKLYVG